MTSDVQHVFWDACVFIRYITKFPNENWHDIQSFIDNAQLSNPPVKIYYSTLCLAEITEKHFVSTPWGSFSDFLADFRGVFLPVEAVPDVMIRAGELKNAVPVNPNPKDERNQAVRKRTIGTADAIHLMTCVHLRDVRDVRNVVFHTFDNGRNPGHEGKCVPLLDFELWFPSGLRTKRVAEVCGLKRTKPIFPQLSLALPHNDIANGQRLDRRH